MRMSWGHDLYYTHEVLRCYHMEGSGRKETQDSQWREPEDVWRSRYHAQMRPKDHGSGDEGPFSSVVKWFHGQSGGLLDQDKDLDAAVFCLAEDRVKLQRAPVSPMAVHTDHKNVSVDLNPIRINSMCFVLGSSSNSSSRLRSRHVLRQTVVRKFDIKQFGRCFVASVHASSVNLGLMNGKN
eukprot:s1200_g26.t1